MHLFKQHKSCLNSHYLIFCCCFFLPNQIPCKNVQNSVKIRRDDVSLTVVVKFVIALTLLVLIVPVPCHSGLVTFNVFYQGHLYFICIAKIGGFSIIKNGDDLLLIDLDAASHLTLPSYSSSRS